jgi:hypothetical protein
MIRPHEIEDLSDEDEEEDEDDGPRSDYQWCHHCERAYKRGEHRMINGLRMCPYQGCNGDAVYDGWDWDRFREPLPQYPSVPEFGIKYPLYPTDYPVLSKGAEKILFFLVAEIRRGRFDPANEKTLCSFQEVHDALGLQRTDNNWEKSLNSQGLDHLAKWTRTHKLPAISALVVKSTKPRLPVGKEDWCREQIQLAISFDWSPWVPDSAPVTLAEIVQESRSYLEGATSQVTQEIRARCDALRKKTKELLRDADGLLRCKVCDWHKPEDEMISGDIVELHHLDPISEAPDEGRIVTITDAVKLFVPVCPNCHRMIHARTGGGHFDIEALRAILKK